jgi:hypothetical protein
MNRSHQPRPMCWAIAPRDPTDLYRCMYFCYNSRAVGSGARTNTQSRTKVCSTAAKTSLERVCSSRRRTSVKREAHPAFSSMEGQRARAHATYALQSKETIRTSLNDLHQFRAWDESGWSIEQDKPPFPPQAVASPLLIHSCRYLQTPLWLKPSPVNRTLMSLKPSLSWATNTRVMPCDPSSSSQVGEREGGILWQRTESFLF